MATEQHRHIPEGTFLSTHPEGGFPYPGQRDINQTLSEDAIKEKDRLSRAITRDVLAFNSWLKIRNPDDFCVDADSTTKTTRVEPINEAEALKRFRGHILSIDQMGEFTPESFELARDRLVAQVAYREEIARTKRGEPKTPYNEYLTIVDGFGERDVDRHVLEDGRDRVIKAAIECNIPLPNNNDGLMEGLRKYNDDAFLASPKDIEAHYWLYAPRFRTKFAQALDVDLSRVDYEFIIKNKDEFWKFYERLEKTGNKLWLNRNKRHIGEYNRGLVESYAPHEDSHFDIGEVIRQEIASGKIDQVVGLITIPGPDAYYLEGIALTAHDWASFNLSDDGKLGASIYRLEKIALLKGLFDVEHGEPASAVTKEIARYIPLKTLDHIEALLVEGTTEPFARAFQPVYGRSVLDFEEIGNNLTPDNRIAFIRSAVKNPTNRRGIRNKVASLLVA